MNKDIKISFFSNYLNHHQIPFSNEMYQLISDNYKFVATEKMDEERLKLGWGLEKQYPYAIDSFVTNENYQRALQLGLESDVVIIGSAPEIFVKERLKKHKLTFRYSERFFKKGFFHILSPRAIYGYYSYHTKYRNEKNFHMLCASGYTSLDCNRIFAYPNRHYKWGYFTELINYDINKLFEGKKNNVPLILWAGRFLSWKHTDDAIRAAMLLNKAGYKFKFDIIGSGEREEYLKELVLDYGLNDIVTFLGVMAPDKVREYMVSANIYLFTSDFNEGWGAVLNESMNSGCAVIASHAIGSVPFLIKHNYNGLIYKSGDVQDLFNKVKFLLDNPDLVKLFGKNALETMNIWCPKQAALNFIELSTSFLENTTFEINNGPCSKAEIIKADYIRNL